MEIETHPVTLRGGPRMGTLSLRGHTRPTSLASELNRPPGVRTGSDGTYVRCPVWVHDPVSYTHLTLPTICSV